MAGRVYSCISVWTSFNYWYELKARQSCVIMSSKDMYIIYSLMFRERISLDVILPPHLEVFHIMPFLIWITGWDTASLFGGFFRICHFSSESLDVILPPHLEFFLSIMPKLWGNRLHWHRKFPKMVWAGDIENHKIFKVQYFPIPRDFEDFSILIVSTIW